VQFPNSHNPHRKQTQGWKCQKKQQLDTERAWPDVEKDDGGHEREKERESGAEGRGGVPCFFTSRNFAKKRNSKIKIQKLSDLVGFSITRSKGIFFLNCQISILGFGCIAKM
jgi:hypothetical protein